MKKPTTPKVALVSSGVLLIAFLMTWGLPSAGGSASPSSKERVQIHADASLVSPNSVQPREPEVGLNESGGVRDQAPDLRDRGPATAPQKTALVFPRNDRSLVELLDCRPERLKALAWRNSLLNPDDKENYCSTEWWIEQELAPVLDELAVMRRLRSERIDQQRREIAARAKSGELQPLECVIDETSREYKLHELLARSLYADDPRRAEEMMDTMTRYSTSSWKTARELDVVFHYGQHFCGATYAQLPETNRWVTLELDARNNSGVMLIGLFMHLGMLSDVAGSRLVSELICSPPFKVN